MVRPWYGDDAVQGGAMTRFAMAFLVGAMPSVASARPNNAALGVCSDVACRVAVINAASLRPSRNGRIGFKPPYSKGGKDPYGQAGHRGIGRGIDRRSGVCGNTVGGGIFALRRPRPYSRHCGEADATYAASTIICARMGINGNGEWGDNDAACRVVLCGFCRRESHFYSINW